MSYCRTCGTSYDTAGNCSCGRLFDVRVNQREIEALQDGTMKDGTRTGNVRILSKTERRKIQEAVRCGWILKPDDVRRYEATVIARETVLQQITSVVKDPAISPSDKLIQINVIARGELNRGK